LVSGFSRLDGDRGGGVRLVMLYDLNCGRVVGFGGVFPVCRQGRWVVIFLCFWPFVRRVWRAYPGGWCEAGGFGALCRSLPCGG